MYLHETEKIKKDERKGRAYVLVETRDFAFEASGPDDPESSKSMNQRVAVFVTWGDDQPEDEVFFHTWEMARQWLDRLMQASRKD